MHAQYWGLVDIPFQSTIDRRWFYEGPTHEEALARLLFLVEQRRRCGLLAGSAGTGKSMLLSVLKHAVKHAQGEAVAIDLVGMDATDLLWELASQLRLSPQADDSRLTLWRKVEDALLGNCLAQTRTVLLFDHLDRADNSCPGIIARLMHLNCRSTPWTTIIAAVRKNSLPEYRDIFQDAIDLQIEVATLNQDESRDYVLSQLKSVGRRESLFTDAALNCIFEKSNGLPREINRLCDLSLLSAMSTRATSVSEDVVASVAASTGSEATVDAPAASRF